VQNPEMINDAAFGFDLISANLCFWLAALDPFKIFTDKGARALKKQTQANRFFLGNFWRSEAAS